MLMRSSPLSGASIDYLEELYRLFRSHPERLDETWRCVFHVLDTIGDATGLDIARELSARIGTSGEDAQQVEILRSRGHLFAALDPLGRKAAIDLDNLQSALSPPAVLDDVTAKYLGTMALETAHIDDTDLRNWLIEAWEGDWEPVPPVRRRDVLHDLIRADEFERFMARKFAGKKRFGAEGAEAIVPLLRSVLRHAASAGVTHVVIGTMHRGRLNLCANVLGRPLAQTLAELKGAHPFPADPARPGDVPYHLGHVGRVDTGAGVLDVTLLANPSHLEAIDPMVLGQTRARQDSLPPGSGWRVLPLILHTDAALVGQGVVAETLQLATVPGFSTAGTIHLIVNNQIGFTTEPTEARTSKHCTGPWKAVDSCILHVNGDDESALVKAAALAVDWRQTHGRDAVIDLVCYRRNGHNEIDEPTFTQPLMYQRIAAQEPVAAAATRRLVAEGIVTEADASGFAEGYRAGLEAAYLASTSFRSTVSGYRDQGPARRSAMPTGVERDRLDAVCKALIATPESMALHPKMGRILSQRALGDRIAWPLAEALAFGTLLEDGVNVRLSGQDVVRGAFSHRHYTLVDTVSGSAHTALSTLGGGKARFAIHNSPLSEYAVLGFEYGYSLDRPNDLTVWEAQFGDFANGAQIVIDQFIAAGEEKWCSPSGLVVLLPHGLEGQGPEHSSARLERFLQLAAGGNMRIANPSTPANYFHILRRQALVAERKPLILMATKRLLRLAAATSTSVDFGPDRRFAPVIVHASSPSVKRIILCSGKIAYDLVAERERRGSTDVAIVSLEELYPLPVEALRDVFAERADAACLWVQEEPRNMGAWSYLDRRIEQIREEAGLRFARLAYVGRTEAGSPAGSFHGDHDDEQARIVADAFERVV